MAGQQRRFVYEFGPFRLDPSARRLQKEGQVVLVGAKAFDILVLLVDNAGNPVEKEAVISAVWPDTFVEESNLTHHMAVLRKILGDTSDGQPYIKTLPKRGYQFVGSLNAFQLEMMPATSLDEPEPVVPIRRHGWSKSAIVPVWFILALAAGIFAWRTWSVPKNTGALQAVPLFSLPGVSSYPSLSPDGNHVAFTWNGLKQDNPDIYVQQIGAGSPLRLTQDPANDFNPVWSPDGRWIAFLRLQSEAGQIELRLIAPLGGPERKLGEIRVSGGNWVTPPYMAWCPDSNCLVVTDSLGEEQPVGLFVISLDAGEKKPLTNARPPVSGDTHPAVSPDGRWLVFRRGSGMYSGQLYRLPLGKGLVAAGEPQRIAPDETNAAHPAWLPGSKEILYSARGGLWRLEVAGEGAPARIPYVGEYGVMPVISQPQPGGHSRLVYVRSFEDLNIWRVETSSPGATAFSPPVVAIASTRRDGTPQLSPDGRRVAFFSDRNGEPNIWVSDLDGSNAIKLTSMMNSGITGYPHWSPDGQWIAYHSSFEIFLVPAGGGKARNMTSHPARDRYPSFSHDGKWIYFTSNRTGGYRTWKMPASGGEAVQVSDALAFQPEESPDGTYLYYVQTVETPGPLWRVPLAGGAPVKMLDRVMPGNYVVLERGIYYIERPSHKAVIISNRWREEAGLRYFDFGTGRSTTVAANLGRVDSGLMTATRDGRTILYHRIDFAVDDLMLVENFR